MKTENVVWHSATIRREQRTRLDATLRDWLKTHSPAEFIEEK